MFNEVKRQLHDYIDGADETALIALISFAKDEPWKKEYVFDEETLKMLDKRCEDYESGKVKAYPMEESMA